MTSCKLLRRRLSLVVAMPFAKKQKRPRCMRNAAGPARWAPTQGCVASAPVLRLIPLIEIRTKNRNEKGRATRGEARPNSAQFAGWLKRRVVVWPQRQK